MYESMQIPPPPVRMRTKFYSPTNYDSSDYAQVYKPKTKSTTKSMANLSINDTSKPEVVKVHKKNEENGSVRKRDYGKGHSAPPVPLRSSSKSMSNLTQVNENRCGDNHYKCPNSLTLENNFRNYSVSSVNSNCSLKSKNSKSMSNLNWNPNQKGPRFSLIHSRKYSDTNGCCLHSNSTSSKSSNGSSKSKSLSASSKSLRDSNWSLQSSCSLSNGRSSSSSNVPPPPPR